MPVSALIFLNCGVGRRSKAQTFTPFPVSPLTGSDYCWKTSVKWILHHMGPLMEHQTGKGTPAVHQNALSSHTPLQPTRPQTFPESFYQCHLILPKVKAAPAVRDSVVGEGKVVVVVVGTRAEIKTLLNGRH